MSAINSISTAAPPSATGAGFSDLSSQEFLNIMISELTNQDPLAPTETKEILDQISSIRSIESDVQLTSRLESLVGQNQLSLAGGLIGKVVSGLSSDNDRVTDQVVSVSATSDGAELNLAGGQRVSMNQVDQIFDPALTGPSGPSPSLSSGLSGDEG